MGKIFKSDHSKRSNQHGNNQYKIKRNQIITLDLLTVSLNTKNHDLQVNSYINELN